MLLKVEQLNFAYRARPVLREVSFTLQVGEVVAVLGPNGCGKSTLLRALLGQVKSEGRVAWNDRNVDALPARELARLAAYLPQSPSYEPGQTVFDALRLGRVPHLGMFGLESSADLVATMSVAGLLGLSDLLSRPIDSLSSGQRQRVFIGRCLAQEPVALLLDEPDTFLDVKRQLELWTLLRKLSRERGVAVLVVSHALNTASAMADRLILLHEGRIAADGSPADVLEPELLGTIWDVPMEKLARPGGAAVILPRIGPSGEVG